MFKVGQKVECINVDETEDYAPIGLKLGKTYTVVEIGNCFCGCGTEVLHLGEVPSAKKVCAVSFRNMGFSSAFMSYRFKPLVESWVDELLEKIELEVDVE